jgi:putative ABC transport system permease protein
MVGLYVHAQRLVDRQRMDRLWVTMRFPDRPYTGLPASLATQVEQLDGVIAVGAAHWLNGFHREPRDRASVMAVDEGMQRAWPEAPVAAAQWARLFAERDGVFASYKAAERWNLRAGDSFQLTTPDEKRADGNPTREFRVLGFVGEIPERDQGFFLGNTAYVDESAPAAMRGLGNMLIAAIADPNRAGEICRAIDRHFANSGTPTYCVPARANEQAMMNTNVNITMVTLSVAGAGLFMILFLVANSIARSVSERTPEFAVLETIGFRHTHLMALVAAEAAIPCLLGAILGTAAAHVLNPFSNRLLSGDLRYILSVPELPLAVLGWSLAAALALAIFSSVMPLSRLLRLNVVDALARR